MSMSLLEREPESRESARPSPDDLVFAHLRRAFPRLKRDQSVGDALAALRAQPPVDPIVDLYVLDDHDRLQGIVPIPRLIAAPPHRTVSTLMATDVVSVPADATMAEASAMVLRHRRLAAPVVGALGRMYGVVDVATLAAEMSVVSERQAGEDLFQLIGLHLSRAASLRDRLRSLLWTLAGGLVAAAIAAWYEPLIETVIVLALFLPVVLALSETVSLQSATLTLQTLRGRRIDWRLMRRSLWREVAAATVLGTGCGGVIGGVAWAWQGRAWLAASVTATVACAMVAASLLGVLLPGALRVLRRDPGVASGPLVLAMTDFVTLLLYFGIATAMLG